MLGQFSGCAWRLKDLNPRHRMTPQALSFLQVLKPGEGANNLYLRTDWGVVDILSSVLGLGDFERLKTHAETITIGGKPCRLIGLEDLIVAKEAMGREKDLLAAKELRAVAAKRRPPGSEGRAGDWFTPACRGWARRRTFTM